jgi:hypothetical protein
MRVMYKGGIIDYSMSGECGRGRYGGREGKKERKKEEERKGEEKSK